MNTFIFEVVLFLSNTVQTITGFAGTLLAMPFSIRLVGIQEAKAVLNLFALVACAAITMQNRSSINIKVLGRMVSGMLLGMLLGLFLFQRLPLPLLLTIYAWFIIAVACKKLMVKQQLALPEWGMTAVLFAAGIIHGMFLSGGALLVLYAAEKLPQKDEFRATLAPVWVILNSILIVPHFQAGYYTVQTIWTAVFSLLPLAASIWVGNLLYRHIRQEQFLKLTYVLLLVSGVSLLL